MASLCIMWESYTQVMPVVKRGASKSVIITVVKNILFFIGGSVQFVNTPAWLQVVW